jgi:uncharacterized surface protein with fasciclin (FAS1) repeats
MRKLSLLLFFVSAVFLTSCNTEAKKDATTENETKTEVNKKGQSAVVDKVSDPNALQVAQSLDDFKTLVVAIEAAGVEDALVNAGPLTVFAPVNGAFDKLPEGLVADLLKPENKSKLAYILKNHVAPANFPVKTLEKNVRKNRKLYMASGKYLEVTKDGDALFVGGTKILKSVKVSNGWVHVIGDILVPAED